jgi:hypothetical protein
MRLRIILVLVISYLGLFATSAAAANLFCPTTDASGKCTSGVCAGQAANSPTCRQASDQTKNGNDPVVDTINTAANIIALVAGIGAVIMIIISGFKFTTAGGAAPGQRAGDPNAIKSARATLVASITGLVALAFTITIFITYRLFQ